MKLQENFSLKKYNTFGLDIRARYFAEIRNPEELTQINPGGFNQILFLGEGSNMLFLNDYDGLVLHNEIKGLKVLSDNPEGVIIEIGGGENWHEVVEKSVQNNWTGIENLALIPGKAGTAPVQNIGAYGREIKDVLVSCRVYDFLEKKFKEFSNRECQFGYRYSIFKRPENRQRFFIHHITLYLKKNAQPEIQYHSLKKYLAEKNTLHPTSVQVFEAVVEIRRSKLPDPAQIGNAGSFFKNPVVNKEHFLILQKNYPEMPYYKISENQIKIPAGWLIEKAGWKGYRRGDAGVHAKQALVLINYGKATGQEIYDLSEEIIKDIDRQFQIKLEREVNVIR